HASDRAWQVPQEQGACYASNQREQTVYIRGREIISGHPETEPEPNLHAAEDRCDCRVYYPRDALGVYFHVRHSCRGRTPHGRVITRSFQDSGNYRYPGDGGTHVLFFSPVDNLEDNKKLEFIDISQDYLTGYSLI